MMTLVEWSWLSRDMNDMTHEVVINPPFLLAIQTTSTLSKLPLSFHLPWVFLKLLIYVFARSHLMEPALAYSWEIEALAA